MLYHDRYNIIFPSPLGNLGVILKNAKLAKIELLTEDDLLKLPRDTLSRHIIAEFSAYFADSSHPFDIELHLEGTPFQQRVWQAMRAIPSGQTMAYGQLAKQLKTGPRAIGQACRTNPIIIIIPCHRIVGSSDIGGYSGARNGRWLGVKKWLLTHENSNFTA